MLVLIFWKVSLKGRAFTLIGVLPVAVVAVVIIIGGGNSGGCGGGGGGGGNGPRERFRKEP